MAQPADFRSHYETQSHERAATACFNIVCNRAGSLTVSLEGQNAGMLGRFMASPRPRLTLTCLTHISDSPLRVCVCLDAWVCVYMCERGYRYVKEQTLPYPKLVPSAYLERMHSEHKPTCLYADTPIHTAGKHLEHVHTHQHDGMTNVPRRGFNSHGRQSG